MYWITRIRTCIFPFLACTLLMGQAVGQEYIEDAPSKEYQIKAAFLYNFIKFVDWPKEKMADSNEPIIIGIIGKDPFGDAFEPIKDKPVKDRKVVIKRFKGFKELKKSDDKNKSELNRQIQVIRTCHMLYICSSEKKRLTEIINFVKNYPVLTVGDIKDFLEAGGIINFLIEQKRVRFEINVAAAKRARLKIRSQLLRLAKRVIREKPADQEKN